MKYLNGGWTLKVHRLTWLHDLFVLLILWVTYTHKKVTKDEFQTLIDAKRIFQTGLDFAKELREVADMIWEDGEKPASKEENKWLNFASTLRRKADEIRRFSLPTPSGFVRYIDIKADEYHCTPFDVSDFLHNLIQPIEQEHRLHEHHQCQVCGEDLRESESCFVLGKNGYCVQCITLVDYTNDAEIMGIDDFLAIPEEPPYQPYSSILVSATLATGTRDVEIGSKIVAMPDFEAVRAEYGISEALEIIVKSPFNYPEKLTLYIPVDFHCPK